MRVPASGPAGSDPTAADREWQDALAIVQREIDDGVLEEAHEVYLAVAARIRLRDRRGWVRLTLRNGVDVVGDVARDDPVADHLVILAPGCTHVIAERAVIEVWGSQVHLRGDEPESMVPVERTLASWLREAWIEGRRVEAVTAPGSRRVGSVTFVGADHVEVSGSDSAPVVLPFTAVDVWSVLA